MKKLILAVLFVFALSSVAMASPLTDFSKGKAALDLNYRANTDYDANVGITYEGTTYKTPKFPLDGDNNLEWGFTYGIGNNWALQYRQATPTGKLGYSDSFVINPEQNNYSTQQITETEQPITVGYNIGLTAKTKVDEYNLMYKLDKNFVFFTGLVKASPSVKLGGGLDINGETVFGADAALMGHDKNIWQFGVQAVAPFADKFTGYGIASFGSDYRNWELGVGYQLSKDLELNVNYRNLKIDNMTMIGLTVPAYGIGDVTSDVQQKGWGFGVTYKF